MHLTCLHIIKRKANLVSTLGGLHNRLFANQNYSHLKKHIVVYKEKILLMPGLDLEFHSDLIFLIFHERQNQKLFLDPIV